VNYTREWFKAQIRGVEHFLQTVDFPYKDNCY